MNPDGKVRGLPRQAKIALAGILGVGVLGVTAYLLLGQPQNEEAARTELLSVSSTPAKAPTASSTTVATSAKTPTGASATPATPTATPTVRTQKPLTIPELPFLVNTPGGKTAGGSSSKPGDGTTTATNADTGLKNPFQPFRVKPKVPTTPVVDPGRMSTAVPPTVQPSMPTEPLVIRPTTTTPTNNPGGPIVVPTTTPLTPLTPPTTVTTTPPRPMGSTPPITVPGTTKLPNPPNGPATPVVIAVKPIIKTPLPNARAWRSSTPVTLPISLSGGTLPAIPPVMSQTVGAPRPEDAPPVRVAVGTGQLPGSSNVPDTLEGLGKDVTLLTPGQKLIPDPPPAPPLPPEPSALETLVKDQAVTFSSVVLGPVNTAIFNTKNGFIVVPLGQTLPNSEVLVQTVTANSATLQLGTETLELTLDRR